MVLKDLQRIRDFIEMNTFLFHHYISVLDNSASCYRGTIIRGIADDFVYNRLSVQDLMDKYHYSKREIFQKLNIAILLVMETRGDYWMYDYSSDNSFVFIMIANYGLMTEDDFANRCITTFNGEIQKYFNGNEDCLGARYVEVLESMGYWFKTVRVWNNDVMAELSDAVDSYRLSKTKLFVPDSLADLSNNIDLYTTYIDVVPSEVK